MCKLDGGIMFIFVSEKIRHYFWRRVYIYSFTYKYREYLYIRAGMHFEFQYLYVFLYACPRKMQFKTCDKLAPIFTSSELVSTHIMCQWKSEILIKCNTKIVYTSTVVKNMRMDTQTHVCVSYAY